MYVTLYERIVHTSLGWRVCDKPECILMEKKKTPALRDWKPIFIFPLSLEASQILVVYKHKKRVFKTHTQKIRYSQ